MMNATCAGSGPAASTAAVAARAARRAAAVARDRREGGGGWAVVVTILVKFGTAIKQEAGRIGRGGRRARAWGRPAVVLVCFSETKKNAGAK